MGYLCLTDSGNLPQVNVSGIDKVVHFCMHFGFTLSWIIFFKKSLKEKTADDAKAYLISFIFSVFAGITVEILQGVLTATRSADVTDVLANTLGATFAIFVAVQFKKYLDKI
jgi:VanZ family protein